ncbi:MAG: SIS domain-containing protein [Gammaproteobacteria bacterium]|nr:SIS domain-containing protein [Gammaproteobacteria bacterium]
MSSHMHQEALSVPDLVAQQLSANYAVLTELAMRVHAQKPLFAMTIARGSSDHAATFAKYLLETQMGMITASAAPSVVTIYKTKLFLKNCLVIAISQSGESPDLTEMLSAAKEAGAITVAFVNQQDSPLAEIAEFVVPLGAGKEISVAATKSYLLTLSALVQFVALLKQDPLMLQVLTQLPAALAEAASMDWTKAIDIYREKTSTFVVARGYGFPIAQEAALKFKETARIHAEAFSGAELLHGPFALIEKDFPLMMFIQHDASLEGMMTLAKRMHDLGACVLLAAPKNEEKKLHEYASVILPMPSALHPVCDPLLVIQAFYLMMSELAVARGLNPDVPTNLSKVTKTW